MADGYRLVNIHDDDHSCHNTFNDSKPSDPTYYNVGR